MSPEELQGHGRLADAGNDRFTDPFRDHVVLEGLFPCLGYLLRIENYGGHWVALLRHGLVSVHPSGYSTAVLCDSMHAMPFSLSVREVEQLFIAMAIEGVIAREFEAYNFCSRWGCFLFGFSIE